MDNWNNEQKPDVSVSGQFSGNPYQDQNQNQNQNTYDQSAGGTGTYNQPLSGYDQSGSQPSGTGSYGQTQNVASTYDSNSNANNAYGQPNANNAYGQPNTNNAYGQPNINNAYGQPNANNAYGQPNNNYASGYGQPFANYNQPPYQAPGFTPTEMEEPVGVGEWTGLLALASFVPCIGLILLLVWAFGGSEKKSKSNFCKAYLIIVLIKIALYALLFIIWGASIASVIENF